VRPDVEQLLLASTSYSFTFLTPTRTISKIIFSLNLDVSPRLLFHCTCIQCARKVVQQYWKYIFMLATEVHKFDLWKIHNCDYTSAKPVRVTCFCNTRQSPLKMQIRFSHRCNLCLLLKITCIFPDRSFPWYKKAAGQKTFQLSFVVKWW
jgi:hypothetical protein